MTFDDINGASTPFPERVLLVEDNLIIALDTEEVILELGAREVVVCDDIEGAKEACEAGNIGFAMLDINLGDQTSFEVAELLLEMRLPFIFASGYGDTSILPEHLAHVPVIGKPYDPESISRAVGLAMRQSS